MFDIPSIKQLLSTPKRIVITAHSRPDGDAMGSSLGLMHFLKTFQHKVNVIVPNDYPGFLNYLPGNDEVLVYDAPNNQEKGQKLIAEAEIIFSLDYNTLKRIEGLGILVEQSEAVKIMIDHHLAPDDFADYMLSQPDASSTAELIYDFIYMLEESSVISPEIATCLYTGLCTDTGRFKHSVSEKVHNVAAALIKCQANINQVHLQVFDYFSESRLRLLGYCLSKRLRVYPKYHCAFVFLTRKDFMYYNVQTGDTEGLVNYPLSLKGVNFVALLKEDKDKIKISFRSRGAFSTNKFARQYFSGGGHKHASGGSCQRNIYDTMDYICSLLPPHIEELANPVDEEESNSV